MRAPRRPRTLSEGEARLWGEIAKLVTPLRPHGERGHGERGHGERGHGERGHGERRTEAPPASAVPRRPSPASTPKPAETAKAVARPNKLPNQPKPHRVKLADLAPPPQAAPPRPVVVAPPPKQPGLERRERLGLRRGILTIEARIDLHGLYQSDAHAALIGFLMRSRAAGHARVLVVTGKGEDGGEGGTFSERGVLRRSVPHWLRGGELRGVVLGFEEAARHHGGAGALYVRLRRR